VPTRPQHPAGLELSYRPHAQRSPLRQVLLRELQPLTMGPQHITETLPGHQSPSLRVTLTSAAGTCRTLLSAHVATATQSGFVAFTPGCPGSRLLGHQRPSASISIWATFLAEYCCCPVMSLPSRTANALNSPPWT
jgi:hypothetical protein